MTLAELSPFELKRERIARLREAGLITKREWLAEQREAEREARAEKIRRAAERARQAHRGLSQ